MTLHDFVCISPIEHTEQRHGRYGHMAVAGSLPTDGWPSRSYGTWVPNSGGQDLMIRWSYTDFTNSNIFTTIKFMVVYKNVTYSYIHIPSGFS